MKAPRTAWWVYVIGLVPLALFSKPLRAALGDWWAFAAVVVYLLLLRLLAEVIERRLNQ